ncbi:electron transfer flavoprotein subunit alpha/FixB family protein [candidate division KSB1 bacterium]|nr:electron transfer flavoprotein subunit alpha/FixB family protein [candidate division KSB1 bacterium]NIR70265.1 electron transfer flavoprotein subunit alpha/FixB family protein [candidate division KSB1 bacterium]NIS26536.1 electron transfer flavoprotein subunit alpha/FixB family protein [candidate division KSB1 bacterium]NIT73298.1 electron transfer flavoprotein subunit alpha/FixB family protein [candidate division KSB1 bacterium]NIU23922.1 electron transfer flavoprotein subunit alpha/FixB fa
MPDSIMVVGEQRDGVLNRSTWEAVVAGQQIGKELGQEVNVLVLGDDLKNLGDEIASKGVNVLIAEDDKLADYTPDGYAAAIKQIVEKGNPTYIFFSHTYMVRDYAPKLATQLNKALISDCTRYKMENGTPIFVRQVFQGKIDADFSFEGEGPNLVSFQVGAFNPDDVEEASAKGQVQNVDLSMDDVDNRTKVLKIFEGVKQEVDLSKAERIVAVGRGIKKPENMNLINKLAEAINAEIAASRPVCDDGWLPLDRQIGSSGQTVTPKLYLAVGISGAIQHIVGMKNSNTIVAINKDPHAPIFDIADYGVVGDLFEVVPELIQAINEVK